MENNCNIIYEEEWLLIHLVRPTTKEEKKYTIWREYTRDYLFNLLSANPKKLVKHTQTIRRQNQLLPTNCLSVFDQFVGLVLKGWKSKINANVFINKSICTFDYISRFEYFKH